MGQQEIYEILSKSNLALSLAEISKISNKSVIEVSRALKVMERYGEIKTFYLPHYIARKFYKTKRGMKLYFIL